MSVERLINSLKDYIKKIAEAYDIDPRMAMEIFRVVAEKSANGGNGVSDIELEEITGYKQQEVRGVLRMFYNERIMSYVKGKLPSQEAVRYFWKTDPDMINLAILKKKMMALEKLKLRLEYERMNQPYVCPRDGSRYPIKRAFDYNFLCPKCGAVLVPDENGATIRALETAIKELEEEIAEDEKKLYGS